jgi:hypothetical protein
MCTFIPEIILKSISSVSILINQEAYILFSFFIYFFLSLFFAWARWIGNKTNFFCLCFHELLSFRGFSCSCIKASGYSTALPVEVKLPAVYAVYKVSR